MEFLILVILVIVFCLCIGISPWGIFIGLCLLFFAALALCVLFFIYNILRIVISGKRKAVFTRVDKTPNGKYTVAYYKTDDGEYPCIFPNEPMLKKILYKEDKETPVFLDKKYRRVYDRYTLITCFTGLAFGVFVITAVIYFIVSKGVTLG